MSGGGTCALVQGGGWVAAEAVSAAVGEGEGSGDGAAGGGGVHAEQGPQRLVHTDGPAQLLELDTLCLTFAVNFHIFALFISMVPLFMSKCEVIEKFSFNDFLVIAAHSCVVFFTKLVE